MCICQLITNGSFPFFGTRSLVKFRVGLGLGFSVRLSESFVADCRQRIPGDRLPVAGRRYTTNMHVCTLTSQCCDYKHIETLSQVSVIFRYTSINQQ